ncbi:hypothetical protein SLS60_000321 [Paraconiothyrium brasiliense]|uniref:Uncharacterized protein n=1 Tax=Paraconiothyrium brasiliense TaxID=300254 RepID=A0ABR3S5Y9_9PLEO
MLRPAVSRARAAVHPRAFSSTSSHSPAVLRPKHLDSTQDSPHLTNPDTLATTSFSPMNPGVTVTRSFPEPPQPPQDASNPHPNISALVATSTSCSPANPGATLPLFSALNVELGSRPRVLEDIPSIMKRFDVPVANVLRRFPDTPQTTSHAESKQTATKPETKTPVHKMETTAPRPWFFKLPAFLRPREGTTYYGTLSLTQEAKVVGKPNVFQYILYGKPDPDARGEAEVEVAEKRTVWQAVLYGVVEADGGHVGTIADVKGSTIEGEKVGDGVEGVVAVENVEKKMKKKKVEKAKMGEIFQDVGYGIVAK